MALSELQATGKAMEIMLVEDSLLDAHITIEALRKCGIHHRLTLFRDGDEAEEFLLQRGIFYAPHPTPRCDLARSDPAAHRRRRAAEDDPRSENIESIPVVVLTSSDDGADRQACEARRYDVSTSPSMK